MQIYLFHASRGGETRWILMYQHEKNANAKLLEFKREMNRQGYRVVSDEKKAGEYRYMQLSKRVGDSYLYAWVNFSLETVL